MAKILAFVNLAQICSFSYPKVTRFTHPPLRSVHCDPPFQLSSLFPQICSFSNPKGHPIQSPLLGKSFRFTISALLALRQVSSLPSPRYSRFVKSPASALKSLLSGLSSSPLQFSGLLLQPSSLFSQVSHLSSLLLSELLASD